MYALKSDGRLVAMSAADEIAFEAGSQLDRVNCASQVSATLLPENPYSDYIALRHSEITIERDGAEIFRGQAVDRLEGDAGHVKFTCLGDLSYLRDGLIAPFEYSGSAAQLVAQVLSEYNGQADSRRRIQVGTIGKTGLGSSMIFSNTGDRSAWDLLTGLADKYGGFIRIRRADNGSRVFDWLDDSGHFSTQPILWGVNLLRLNILRDATGIVNSIYATSGDNLSALVEDAASIARFGRARIARSYEAADATELVALARRDLAGLKGEALQISGQAVDLGTTEPERYEPFNAGDFAQTVSYFHRINQWIMISELKHDLTGAAPTQVTLGMMQDSLVRSARSGIINAWIVERQGITPPAQQ